MNKIYGEKDKQEQERQTNTEMSDTLYKYHDSTRLNAKYM